jgi:hypothetical protein
MASIETLAKYIADEQTVLGLYREQLTQTMFDEIKQLANQLKTNNRALVLFGKFTRMNQNIAEGRGFNIPGTSIRTYGEILEELRQIQAASNV